MRTGDRERLEQISYGLGGWRKEDGCRFRSYDMKQLEAFDLGGRIISQFSPTHLADLTVLRKELDLQHLKIKSLRLKLPHFGFPSPEVVDCTHRVPELGHGNLDQCCYVQPAPPISLSGGDQLHKPDGQGSTYSLLWKYKHICLELGAKGGRRRRTRRGRRRRRGRRGTITNNKIIFPVSLIWKLRQRFARGPGMSQ